MPEKMGFWKKLEQSKKLQVLFFVCSMVVIIVSSKIVLEFVTEKNKNKILDRVEEVKDYDILTEFDELQIHEEELIVSGWCLRINSKNISLDVALVSNGGKDVMRLDTSMQKRSEIEKYIKTGWEFGDCGFLARVEKERLKKDISYEVVLLVSFVNADGEKYNKKVSTGRYLFNEELYKYSPEKFESPIGLTEELATVIEKGLLHVYDAENRAWIYEYNQKLFYIADADYGVPLKFRPSIPIALYTYQEDLLLNMDREDYLRSGYETNEIYLSEGNCIEGKNVSYYVASMDIPDFPISHVRAGIYDNEDSGWLYKVHFQMPIATE